MKRVLGLDLGTNSIGWAVVNHDSDSERIIGLGSRIIPMSQDIIGKFETGNSVSQTAERTRYRSVRRLRERHLLRRERLHRVLNKIGFLPEHYSSQIDFIHRQGKFFYDNEPKIAWAKDKTGSYQFIFKESFNEMLAEFKREQPELLNNGNLIPYDWTLYYLRKKALNEAIRKEELAWIILNFNQKRGYYQLRGEEDELKENKFVEYYALRVKEVVADDENSRKDEVWYNIILENDWVYRRSSKLALFDWKGKIKEFIVTTDVDNEGKFVLDKEGNIKRSFRSPKPDDWSLIKKKTESEIEASEQTVGEYIYHNLLKKPSQKLRGKLVRTIERKFYKAELTSILNKQKEFHNELQSKEYLEKCLNELYPNNENHRKKYAQSDMVKLLINDIIFYQRPLKSKKSEITDCSFEYYIYKNKNGELNKIPLKGIPKSHPFYQEFRIWKFISDLRIYKREAIIDGRLKLDADYTDQFLRSENDYVNLFEWLQERKEITQDSLLSGFFKLKKSKGEDNLPFRWNYVEDKSYPVGETHAQIISRLEKTSINYKDRFSMKDELALWHILYSVNDKAELGKALQSYATKRGFDYKFTEAFLKFPPFKKDYANYSLKAISKILSLMRRGKYWEAGSIDPVTMNRINKIINGECDEKISDKIREITINLRDIIDFRGLPEWIAKYIIYNRHSEASDIIRWQKPDDIENYLKLEFKQHSLRNPIVEQVVRETLRTVKDIWNKYGEISEIHIELGREMKNPADKRAAMTQQILKNETANLRIKALLMELKNDPDMDDVRPYSPNQQEILRIYEDGVLNSGVDIPEDISKIIKLSQPGKAELTRYKLWLEQKYRSPYTGEVIPLGRLFTSDYQIEHIIPQSRYFDDSITNKVICEAEVNADKDNALGYEYIKNNEGKKIELSRGRAVTIFKLAEYENFVRQYYAGNPVKKKKLLLEDIPESFIQRQLNDSRYISKVIRGLLSNIVREEKEIDTISRNVITCTGGVTSILKKDWGLNDVWNRLISPRFMRLNELTQSNMFGKYTDKGGNKVFIPEVPLALQKGFEKKRIDHRHHAMDALVIACATRNHINYLSNEHARKQDEGIRYDLRNKLRRIEEIEVDRLVNGEKVRKKIKIAREFHKPWKNFTQDTQKALENITPSFKQNIRVLNRATNRYEKIRDGKKIKTKQTKGENYAIRKPLHKDTVAGLVNIRLKDKVSLSSAVDRWNMLVDKSLKTQIKKLITEGYDKKKIIRFFNDHEKKWNGKDISSLEVYYFSNDKEELTASRHEINAGFNRKKIENITDSGIKKIMLKHLATYDEIKGNTIVEHPESAFTPEGIEEMNKNIVELNEGKPHKPILKVRVFEPKGNKFEVGYKGNKKHKYVEAAKGTNLFFAVYADSEGKRSFDTIPLNIVIERLKQGLKEVPESNLNGSKLLFSLSPYDLVYVPTPDEQVEGKINMEQIDKSRIYQFVSSSGLTADFIPSSSASTIFNMNKNDQAKTGMNYIIQNEFGIGSSKSKNERACTGEMIKDVCIKLKIDRLGSLIYK